MSDDFPKDRYEALAEFRYQIRRFQHFSEQTAREAGLEPQQHQLVLAIKGSPSERLSIGEVSERMQIRHHTAAELVARAERRQLVTRVRGKEDRRQVFVTLTPQAEAMLETLSSAHHQELITSAPELIRALQRVVGNGLPGDPRG